MSHAMARQRSLKNSSWWRQPRAAQPLPCWNTTGGWPRGCLAYVSQQFVEMLEMIGCDAQTAIPAWRGTLQALEVQHHGNVLAHLGGGRLPRQLAVGIAYQPVRGEVSAQHRAKTGIE